MVRDYADLHVERWRDHWVDIEFDDDIERLGVRLHQLNRYLNATTKRALAESDLLDAEYHTLHQLMIRDTPGRASPTDLARDTGLSAAGMTKRLDGLEARGWIKRIPGVDDRRRVDVEATKAGMQVWRAAMAKRGAAEDELAAQLTPAELSTLNRLLKKLTLFAEATDLDLRR